MLGHQQAQCCAASHSHAKTQSKTKLCAWASCQICKSAGCACAENAGNVSPPPPRVSDPDMHHGICVTHVSWCMPGSLTSGFLWSWWRGKRSRYSRCMRNPQFYVCGKRPMFFHGVELDASWYYFNGTFLTHIHMGMPHQRSFMWRFLAHYNYVTRTLMCFIHWPLGPRFQNWSPN